MKEFILVANKIILFYLSIVVKSLNKSSMRSIQLFALMQNQVMELRTGMALARNVRQFRIYFKGLVGLPKNASHRAVLQEIGRVYYENGASEVFNDYMVKFNMVDDHGIELV